LTLIQAVPTEIRELDLNVFRLALKDLEDGEDGIPHPDTHQHNTEVTVGGLTLARVIEIINGYTVTFEDLQYAVNLVGANSNVGDVVNVNQVSVRSQNSAGLISSPAIEYASYNGGVTVDVLSPFTGTVFPVGTPQKPVNNLVDAELIAEYRGFHTLYILGDITFGAGDALDSFLVVGENASRTTLTLEAASNINNLEIHNAYVTGYANSGVTIRDCIVEDLYYANGRLFNCVISGGVSLGSSAAGYFLDCVGVPGPDAPFIDLGGSGQSLVIRNYSGGLELRNRVGVDAVSLDFNSGHLTVASTVTAGAVTVRGVVAKVTDNSTGTAVVDVSGVLNNASVANEVWESIVAEHQVAGTFGDHVAATLAYSSAAVAEAMLARQLESNKVVISEDDLVVTIYEDDGVTILHQFDVSEDKRIRIPR